MSEPLTPQRVVGLIEAHLLLLTHMSAIGKYIELHDAFTAALDAYKREHMRLWLEERGVYFGVHGVGASDRWFVGSHSGADKRLGPAWAASAKSNGFPTADAARAAAAEALGYKGLEER